MVPTGLKNLLPGSLSFFFLSLVPAVLLLFRKRDGGRAGKIWVALVWLLDSQHTHSGHRPG